MTNQFIFDEIENEKNRELMKLKVRYIQLHPEKFPYLYKKGIDALIGSPFPEDLYNEPEYRSIVDKYQSTYSE